MKCMRLIKVAMELQQPGQNCYDEMVAQFGENILCQDKNINREELRKIVMADVSELEKLNSIVHPAVKIYFMDIIKLNAYPADIY